MASNHGGAARLHREGLTRVGDDYGRVGCERVAGSEGGHAGKGDGTDLIAGYLGDDLIILPDRNGDQLVVWLS